MFQAASNTRNTVACAAIAFVAIAFISILSRRLKRLVAEELSA
jgi:hypothetical protein